MWKGGEIGGSGTNRGGERGKNKGHGGTIEGGIGGERGKKGVHGEKSGKGGGK